MAIQEQNWQNGTQLPEYFPTASPEEDSFTFSELLQVLGRRRWLILSSTLLVFALGMLMTFLQTRIYESTCNILVADSTNSFRSIDAGALPLLADLQALTQSRSVDTQVEILTNPDLLKTAFEAMPIEDRRKGFHTPTFIYDGASATGKTVAVESKKNTDILTITVRSRDRRCAAEFANSIADTYLSQDLEQNRQATSLARTFVESQLAQAHRKFEEASTALAAFKRRTGFVSPDDQLNT